MNGSILASRDIVRRIVLDEENEMKKKKKKGKAGRSGSNHKNNLGQTPVWATRTERKFSDSFVHEDPDDGDEIIYTIHATNVADLGAGSGYGGSVSANGRKNISTLRPPQNKNKKESAASRNSF